MSHELRAFLDGTPVGSFTQSAQGALGFRYDTSYVARPDATPLSLSLPFAGPGHSNRTVRAWLDGLLPDNQQVRERWGRQYGASANNPFALLRHVGRDAAGAIQILPPGDDPGDATERRGDVEWLSDGEVVAMLAELAAQGADWNPGRSTGRWSLAGAQAKVALYRDPDTARWGVPRDSTPTTHILKPVIRGLADHHLNEVLCLSAARVVGIPAATVDVIEADGVQAMVATRYDRAARADGVLGRLHQEDLCQALSVHPTQKYQSDGGPGVGEIADLIGRLDLRDRAVTASRFLEALAFNVAVGGTDAHAKNYSLLLAGDRARLAPLYDVSSAAPYAFDGPAVGAMRIGAHWVLREIGPSDWARVARRLRLDRDTALGRVQSIYAAVPAAFASAAAGLPESLRARAASIADAVARHAGGLTAPG